MNDRDIATLIGLASQWWPAWRKPESTETLILAWRELLGDVDAQAGLAALQEIAAAGAEFPPPVGVIRKRAAELTLPAGPAPGIDEAWGEVQAEMRRVGHTSRYDRPERALTFSHPAIAAVIERLGWQHLCESDNEVADRAHFTRMYEAAVRRGTAAAARPPAVSAVLEQTRALAASKTLEAALGVDA